jgi:hypothetical protein
MHIRHLGFFVIDLLGDLSTHKDTFLPGKPLSCLCCHIKRDIPPLEGNGSISYGFVTIISGIQVIPLSVARLPVGTPTAGLSNQQGGVIQSKSSLVCW